MLCLDAQPNPAHRKLAELEAAGKLTSVVTQNIDGLHQRAGSRRVWELHGSVHRNHCMRCGRAYPVEFVRDSGGVPRCACGGIVKPDVVLYEEQLDGHTLQGALSGIQGAPPGAHQQVPHPLRRPRRPGDRWPHRGDPGRRSGGVRARDEKRPPV